VRKTYKAVVDGFVQPNDLRGLEEGGAAHGRNPKGGARTPRVRIRIVHRSRDRSVLELTLREGRNLQVRRILAKIGHKVREVTRVALGPLTLKGLALGDSRRLTPREVRELRASVDRDAKAAGERSQSAVATKENDDSSDDD
jgi:23S rRNA pseudouridine2605 synthase